MLKITINHPSFPSRIVYAKPEDILEYSTNLHNDPRIALASMIRQATSIYIPIYLAPDLSGLPTTLVLKENFLSNCLIEIEAI